MTQENVFTLKISQLDVLVEFTLDYSHQENETGKWIQLEDFDINWIEDIETGLDITKSVIFAEDKTELKDLENQITEYINENINEWVEDERHYQRTEE